MRRKYCPNDCDFRKYYLKQAGSGLSDIRIYKSFPYQRGQGLGSVIKRFGVPLMEFLGKHLLSTGMAVGSDVLANHDLKSSLKRRIKEGTRYAAKDGIMKISNMIDQVGTGKKKVYKGTKIRRKTTQRKVRKKDIFS